MKHQTLICFIASQVFVCTAAIPGVGSTIAGVIDNAASGQARSATYIVDQAAPGAADTNPGTEQMPFMTVQYAADIAGLGDIVYVMEGKYDERIKVKAGGTEGKPVVFVAMPRRSVIVGGFDLEASYIRVEGFNLRGKKNIRTKGITVVNTLENPTAVEL